MKNTSKKTWTQRWIDFGRRHPWLLLLIALAMAILTAPLMTAAGKATAVLYQDF